MFWFMEGFYARNRSTSCSSHSLPSWPHHTVHSLQMNSIAACEAFSTNLTNKKHLMGLKQSHHAKSILNKTHTMKLKATYGPKQQLQNYKKAIGF